MEFVSGNEGMSLMEWKSEEVRHVLSFYGGHATRQRGSRKARK